MTERSTAASSIKSERNPAGELTWFNGLRSSIKDVLERVARDAYAVLSKSYESLRKVIQQKWVIGMTLPYLYQVKKASTWHYRFSLKLDTHCVQLSAKLHLLQLSVACIMKNSQDSFFIWYCIGIFQYLTLGLHIMDVLPVRFLLLILSTTRYKPTFQFPTFLS